MVTVISGKLILNNNKTVGNNFDSNGIGQIREESRNLALFWKTFSAEEGSLSFLQSLFRLFYVLFLIVCHIIRLLSHAFNSLHCCISIDVLLFSRSWLSQKQLQSACLLRALGFSVVLSWVSKEGRNFSWRLVLCARRMRLSPMDAFQLDIGAYRPMVWHRFCVRTRDESDPFGESLKPLESRTFLQFEYASRHSCNLAPPSHNRDQFCPDSSHRKQLFTSDRSQGHRASWLSMARSSRILGFKTKNRNC